jgi:hypothetical protein
MFLSRLLKIWGNILKSMMVRRVEVKAPVGAWLPIILLASAACVSGCVHDVEVPSDFVEAELAGRIDGRDWQYKYAYIDPTLETPDEEDVLFVFLPYKPKESCPKSADDARDSRQIRLAAPKNTKLVKIKAGTSKNLTFQYQMKNGAPFATSAKKGKIKLTSVSGDTVKGKLFALSNNNHWVSGNFTAVVCNSLDFR